MPDKGKQFALVDKALYTINLDGQMRNELSKLSDRMETPRSSLVRMAIRHMLDNPASVMTSAAKRV